MLPPGHIAAGFLTSAVVLKILNPQLPPQQVQHLIYWGMFFSFAPDLDSFVSFLNEKAWYIKNPKNNHRKYISHAPILWLASGLLIYFLSTDVYWKVFGLMLWVCSWSHFLLDSIDYGIMWLWPFNKKVFAIKNQGMDFSIKSSNFFGYWRIFVKLYITRLTFYFEILIIITAAALFVSNHYSLITIQ